MRLSKSWVIASKDFKTFRKKRNLLYSILVLPIIVSVLLPLVSRLIIQRSASPELAVTNLTAILPAFDFFYLILAGVIPTAIASYTIVGEKVEKTLEPLLATPTTDGEILLGKGLSAFVPSFGAIIGGSIVFMVLTDLITHGTLGYYYFPSWNAGIILLVMVPLAAVLSVEWNVVVSSLVSDVRVAQQVGMLIVLPFAAIYVLGEIRVFPLADTFNLVVISAILLVVDLLMLFATRATFRREEILTKWK